MISHTNIPPHSVQFVDVTPSHTNNFHAFPNEFCVRLNPIESPETTVWLPQAIYRAENTQKATICIENCGTEHYYLKPSDSFGRIIDVTIHEPNEQVLDLNLVTYDTPKQNEAHWRKVKELLQFGDDSPETFVARKQLTEIFKSHHDIFACDMSEIGLANDTEFDFDITEKPPKQYPRRLPQNLKQEVFNKLHEDLAAGILKHSEGSEYASPVVVIRKKTGELRIATDYRQLNAKMIINAAPLPRIDDIFDSIGAIRPKYFTALDLASGYHQIGMTKEAQRKSAIVCGPYHLEWVRMPFGLACSPAFFMNYMLRTLDGIDNERIFVFLDDLIIVSETLEKHAELLEKVFNRLRERQLRLKPSKCEFLCTEIKFLGLILTKEGLHTDPKKIAAIINYPIPTNLKELRTFLGIAGYFRKFIQNYSIIARPLSNLTRKDIKYEWTSECQIALDTLKEKLTTAPVLVFPDFSKPFFIECDASLTGMGAQLLQRIGPDLDNETIKTQLNTKEPLLTTGEFHPIAFISKAFNKHEINYGASEKEALGVVHACKVFQHYCYAVPVYIITDCSALKYLLTSRELSGKLARWALTIQQMNPVIIYRPGKVNEAADGLSRKRFTAWDKLVANTDPMDEEQDTMVALLHTLSIEPTDCTIALTRLQAKRHAETPTTNTSQNQNDKELEIKQLVRKEQLKDPRLKALFDYYEKELVDTNFQNHISVENPYFTIEEGILYRKDNKFPNLRVVVPAHETQQIIKEHHGCPQAAHLARRRTINKIESKYYWYKMIAEIERFCELCLDCANRKGQQKSHKVPLCIRQITPVPMDTLAIDIHELGLTETGNRYTILAYDLFTKDVMGTAIPDQKAVTVARALVDHVFCIHGTPKQILSDLGKNLCSAIFREVCRIYDIKRLYTTSYNPKANGAIERFHRTLDNMLAIIAKHSPNNWDKYLPLALHAYRTAPHESTGIAPCELATGRKFQMPSQSVFSNIDAQNIEELRRRDEARFLDNLREVLGKLTVAAEQNLEKSRGDMKKNFDAHTKPLLYGVGDIVFFYCHRMRRGKYYKLSNPWVGPMKITALRNYTATLEYVKDPEKQPEIVHVDKLSLAYTSVAREFSEICSKGRDILGESRHTTRNRKLRKNPYISVLPNTQNEQNPENPNEELEEKSRNRKGNHPLLCHGEHRNGANAKQKEKQRPRPQIGNDERSTRHIHKTENRHKNTLTRQSTRHSERDVLTQPNQSTGRRNCSRRSATLRSDAK